MAERRINASFQQRRDSAANWESKNPVLLDGEMITVITNAGAVRHKTGDGTKTYTQLPFDDEPLYNALAGKQDILNSGTNIKTFNGNSILGSGNFSVREMPTVTAVDNGKFAMVVGGAWAAASVPTYAGGEY